MTEVNLLYSLELGLLTGVFYSILQTAMVWYNSNQFKAGFPQTSSGLLANLELWFPEAIIGAFLSSTIIGSENILISGLATGSFITILDTAYFYFWNGAILGTTNSLIQTEGPVLVEAVIAGILAQIICNLM